jgi:hypothetical protein
MRWRGLRRLGLWWPVALVGVVGVAVVAAGQVRAGGYLFSAALALAAVLRAVLPQPRAGGLRVRRRWVDVLSLLGLAAVVVFAFAIVRLEV